MLPVKEARVYMRAPPQLPPTVRMKRQQPVGQTRPVHPGLTGGHACCPPEHITTSTPEAPAVLSQQSIPSHRPLSTTPGRSKRLLVLALALGDLEPLFRRVQDRLDVLDQATLLLVQLGVFLTRLLDEKLYVPQLREVEVALAL